MFLNHQLENLYIAKQPSSQAAKTQRSPKAFKLNFLAASLLRVQKVFNEPHFKVHR
jgi:hypothetical protein